MSEIPYSNTSCVPDLVDDRGPARYFHGRTQILHNFNHLLERAVTIEGRTTVLIQGAPGAGKTALLEEMALDAMEKRWDVFNINLGDLYKPVHMAQTLGQPYVARKQKATKVDANVLSREHIKEVAGDSSVSQVLERMNPKRGVLLILDEAQRIGAFTETPNKTDVMETLDNLHNGKLPHPVILLAAGLGMSKASFGDLGVSRFKGGCFVELGALGKESERAVIHDWLVIEGGAVGDPDPWIDAIALQTHGWPQHISAYGDAAAKQIQNDGSHMTATGLEIVYKLGKERREAYYEQRAEEITRKERCSMARLIDSIPIDDVLDWEDIEPSLSKEYGPEKVQNLFYRALEKGVLHKQKGIYTIPIPSMRDWLVSNYSH